MTGKAGRGAAAETACPRGRETHRRWPTRGPDSRSGAKGPLSLTRQGREAAPRAAGGQEAASAAG